MACQNKPETKIEYRPVCYEIPTMPQSLNKWIKAANLIEPIPAQGYLYFTALDALREKSKKCAT